MNSSTTNVSSQLPGPITRRNALQLLGLAPLGYAVSGAAATESVGSAQPPKVALVTGSSRGIGAAIAKRLAQEGFSVTTNYHRNADLAAEVVRAIEARGGKAISVGADVSDPVQVKRLFDATSEAFGGVDVVVNNAGIMRLSPLAKMSDEDFRRLIDVNLAGGFHVLREAANRVRDGGRIISLSSSITKLRTANYGPYAVTKAALEILSSCLAKELRGLQISVNAIAPGVVNTTLFRDVPGRTPAEIEQFAQRTPHGRIGEPEDIAATIAGLVSADCSWVNGETVFANGGLI